MSDTDLFTPDPRLQDYAIRAGAECVRHMKATFGRLGDYSDGSVAEVQAVLETMRQNMQGAPPSLEELEKSGILFGSYLGETYRRNHGGVWGTTGDRVATLLTRGDLRSTPWGRVQNYLRKGDRHHVSGWYEYLVAQAEPYPPLVTSPPPLPATGAGAVQPPPLPWSDEAVAWRAGAESLSVRKAIDLAVGGVDPFIARGLIARALVDNLLYVWGDAENRLMDRVPYPDRETGKEYQFAFTSMQEAQPAVEHFAGIGLHFFRLPVEEIFDALPPGCGLSIDPFGIGGPNFQIDAGDIGELRRMMQEG